MASLVDVVVVNIVVDVVLVVDVLLIVIGVVFALLVVAHTNTFSWGQQMFEASECHC